MKLQIDTELKVIKLEQSAKLTEILSVVKKLLPNNWKEYSLEVVTTFVNWTNPVVIGTWPYYPPPFYVIEPFTVTTNADNLITASCCSSVTNYEINTN